MERSLATASKDSSKAFDGIYTQAQKVSRALSAAADAKISFKGYAGQIRNIDELHKRLAELGRRQIDISVSGTSFSSVAKLREAIEGVHTKHIDAVRRVGGLENARNIVAYGQSEASRGAYGPVVAVETTGLDEAVAKMSRLRSERDVEIAIKVIDGNLLESAKVQFERLYSVAKEIDEPLSAARQTVESLSIELQTSLHPALQDVQAADERLHAAIEKGANISTKAYRRLRGEVEEFGRVASRAAELDAMTGKIGNGSDLKSKFPAQYDVLNRAGAATASASGLSGGDLRGFGVVSQQRNVDAQARQLKVMVAKRDSMTGDTTDIDAAIARRTARLEKEVATYERLIAAAKGYRDAQPTLGNPSGPFGPAPPPGSKVINGTTRVPVDVNQHSLGASAPYYLGNTPGNPSGPFGPNLSPSMKQARQAAQDLEDTMDQLRAKSNFSITGNVQSVRQAEAEISRLISLVATLDGKQRSALRGSVNDAINSLKSGDISQMQATIGSLQGKMTGMGVRGVKSGDIGRLGVDKFTLAVQQAGFAIDDFFSVTGDFSQRMRAIGNNVTQLGFILGGATGLFIALGVTVGTQVSLMFSKYVLGLEDAKTKQERLAAMTEVLNSSFEGQKEIVESLAESYAKLTKGIQEATLPDVNKKAVDRKETVKGVADQQAAARREMLASNVPEIANFRLKRAGLEKQLAESGSDLAAQADIRSKIKFTVDRENDLVNRLEEGADARIKARDPMLNAKTKEIFESATLNDVRERNKLIEAGADTGPRDAAMRDNSRIAGELTIGLQKIKDAAVLAAFQFTGPLSEAISSAQKEIESLGEFVDKDTRDAITRAGFELADVSTKAAKGALGADGVKREATRIRQDVTNALEGITFGATFKKSMEERQKEIEAARQEADSSAERGKSLSMTPGQRAAGELSEGLLDIRRRFGAIAEDTNGLVDENAILESQKMFAEERTRQSAPAIFNLADQVQNAIMQGPSRAALQANDVTTTQGASELNRLLRGDDSAKNQDLVELQKQSKALDELVLIAKQNGAPPGIFDF
jgi:hypothetical protein